MHEQPRSLGWYTGALSAWTPTQRSRTDRLPASSFGAERTVARLVHWQSAVYVRVSACRWTGEGLWSCARSVAITGLLCDGLIGCSLPCCVGAEWTAARAVYARLTRESAVSVHVGGSDTIHIGARWA